MSTVDNNAPREALNDATNNATDSALNAAHEATLSQVKPWEMQYAASTELFSALSHAARVAICHFLIGQPLTVREIQEKLGLSQPLVSHHLMILRNAHIVSAQSHGRTTQYSISDMHIRHIVVDVYAHTKEI